MVVAALLLEGRKVISYSLSGWGARGKGAAPPPAMRSIARAVVVVVVVLVVVVAVLVVVMVVVVVAVVIAVAVPVGSMW